MFTIFVLSILGFGLTLSWGATAYGVRVVLPTARSSQEQWFPLAASNFMKAVRVYVVGSCGLLIVILGMILIAVTN